MPNTRLHNEPPHSSPECEGVTPVAPSATSGDGGRKKVVVKVIAIRSIREDSVVVIPSGMKPWEKYISTTGDGEELFSGVQLPMRACGERGALRVWRKYFPSCEHPAEKREIHCVACNAK